MESSKLAPDSERRYFLLVCDSKFWLANRSSSQETMEALLDRPTRSPVGLELKDSWEAPDMEIRKGLRGKTHFEGERVDADFLSGEFGEKYLSTKAVEKLKPVFGKRIELLPVHTRLGEFFLINTLERVPGLLDFERTRAEPSKVVPLPLLAITGQLHFLSAPTSLPPIFRLAEEPIRGIYVSSRFKEAVEESKLKGFDFHERLPGIGYS